MLETSLTRLNQDVFSMWLSAGPRVASCSLFPDPARAHYSICSGPRCLIRDESEAFAVNGNRATVFRVHGRITLSIALLSHESRFPGSGAGLRQGETCCA